MIGMYMQPDPPKPEITYGEFPFRIEYELQGERFVIEDTVICEFKGIGTSEASKRRIWKAHLASGKEGCVINLKVFDETKRITCNAGAADYYMGDSFTSPDWRYSEEATLSEGYGTPNYVLYAPPFWYDEYGFRFISWELSDPIVNTFK